MTIGEALGIATSIISFFLGGLSVWLAFYFYTKAKDTEKEITNSLAKIEAQTTSLQKINAKWMDRLTLFATTDRQPHVDPMSTTLVSMLFDLPQTIAAQITQPTKDDTREQLTAELITCYIVIYHYSALANFWAQFYLPDTTEFDETNDFHQLVRRTIDGSSTDFDHIAKLIERVESARIDSNPLAPLLEETRHQWRGHVRSTYEVFARRSTQNQ